MCGHVYRDYSGQWLTDKQAIEYCMSRLPAAAKVTPAPVEEAPDLSTEVGMIDAVRSRFTDVQRMIFEMTSIHSRLSLGRPGDVEGFERLAYETARKMTGVYILLRDILEKRGTA